MALMPAEFAGAPCWISLAARDLAASEGFYQAVFGWTFRRGSFGQAFSPRGRAALALDREGAAFGIWEGWVLAEWRIGAGGAGHRDGPGERRVPDRVRNGRRNVYRVTSGTLFNGR
ncbi:hypothetical protein [Streptomyces sp. WAC07149]|uniref:hypothetical protein n=1 Tax=Streptomyces sp. WAC07149 TaxID=2487425 RepID=UPI00163B77D6|nr:hypothetical protein [Streptomyces sp. WAC07149]